MWTAIASLGLGGISAFTQMRQAKRQRDEQRRILDSAVDPGVQQNYGLARASEILGDNYSNYNLPGLSRFQEQLSTNSATAMDRIREGATSSEDLLSGAARVQSIENQSAGSLYAQEAQGKTAALDRYLNSVTAVGADQVRVNNVQLDRYDALLREAAAMGGASTQNLNNGIQDILMSAAPLIQGFSPTMSLDPNTGEMIKNKPIFQTQYRR